MYLQRSRGETVFTVFNIVFLIALSVVFFTWFAREEREAEA